MSKRRRTEKTRAEPEKKPDRAAPENRPFAELGGLLKKTVAAAPAAPAAAPAKKEPAPKPRERDEDEEALRAALDGVKPLDNRRRERVAPPKPAASSAPIYDEDAEALAKLAAMVEGDEPLGGEFSEEHTEWIAEDVDQAILPRLVAGEFAWQEHVDLHGMTREQAHAAVTRFLAGARIKHLRCVLLVHGRGNHSEDARPVLKPALQRWLRRNPLSGWIFAYATARAVDGGAGAMYVMLRE